MSTAWLAGFLTLFGASPSEAAPGREAVLRVRLATSPQVIVHELEPEEVERVLRERFARTKRLSVVDGEDADLTVTLVECSRSERQRVVTTAKGRPVKVPLPYGVATGGETEYGAQTETTTTIVLKVQLEMQGRFRVIASNPKDKTLREAASTIAAEVDRTVRERQAWRPAP